VSLSEPGQQENAAQSGDPRFEVQHFVCGMEHTLVLVLDLRNLTFIDSSGLHSVLLAKHLCAEHECELLLIPG
jgi:hypothetical protein